MPPPPAYKTAPASCYGNRGGSFALGALFSGAHAKPCEGSFGKPRVCGEKAYSRVMHGSLWGSPPRMRGKERICRNGVVHFRITPAYAGKSVRPGWSLPMHQDHPRICGEKSYSRSIIMRRKGSPPRMRGKVKVHCGVVFDVGITPAHAGKRLKRSRSTVSPVAIVPLFPSVCNKPVVSNGSPAGRDAPLFLPAENAAPAPAGPAESRPASRSSQFPPRITVISPRP